MDLENFGIALIGILGTISGVVIGALVTYLFSLKLAKRVQRLDANRRLANAFTSELSDVYPTAVNWPENIDKYLRSKFPSLQAAIGQFRFFLPASELDSFDQVWFEYYCSTSRDMDRDYQGYHHYMKMSGANNEGEFQQDGHANLKNNIDKILSFAK